MKNEWPAFFLGFLCGFFIVMSSISISSTSYHSQAKAAVIECEKTLPRNQHCKIIAVPAGDQK